MGDKKFGYAPQRRGPIVMESIANWQKTDFWRGCRAENEETRERSKPPQRKQITNGWRGSSDIKVPRSDLDYSSRD